MKKIILISCLFLLTSCDSTEVFETQCQQTINSTNTKYTQKVKFVYNNQDEVLNVIVTNKYKSSDESELELIKDSATDYNNVLASSEAIKIQIVADETGKYTVRYNFDVTKMSQDEIKEFNLNTNWVKLNNKLQESDLECD